MPNTEPQADAKVTYDWEFQLQRATELANAAKAHLKLALEHGPWYGRLGYRIGFWGKRACFVVLGAVGHAAYVLWFV